MERIIYQSTTAEKHAYNLRGSLEEWQRQIGAPCIGNSRLTFAVSAAFAAPCLYLVGAESGGLHFVGPSSLGKTTAARVAGSACGGSDEPLGFLRTWRATANGLEAVAALHCDCLLVLDEISEVTPREATACAYMLSNGSGKSRARRDGSARAPFTWRLLFLSTGEVTLADKVREDSRQRATAGQQVRVLDIPADTGKFGLFEDLHGAANGQVFADRLRDASRQFYGTPIRAYLAELTARRAEVTDKLRAYMKRFLNECVPSGSHPQVRRAAARFALVAAAGELASALEVTGWPKDAAGEAAETCFTAYLGMRGHVGAVEVEAGIEQVRKFLQLHGAARFAGETGDADAQGRTVVSRAGFRLTDGSFAIFKEVF